MTTAATTNPGAPSTPVARHPNEPDAPPERTITLFCEEHWAPYRADHTLNAQHATRRILDHLLEDVAFQTACGRDDEKKQLADANRMYEEGAKLGPICCHTGAADEVLAETRGLRERFMEALARSQIPPVGGHRTSRPGGR